MNTPLQTCPGHAPQAHYPQPPPAEVPPRSPPEMPPGLPPEVPTDLPAEVPVQEPPPEVEPHVPPEMPPGVPVRDPPSGNPLRAKWHYQVAVLQRRMPIFVPCLMLRMSSSTFDARSTAGKPPADLDRST